MSRCASAQALLATGATPHRPAVEGAGLAGIHTLGTLAEADALRDDLVEAEHVVAIGGSYVACEAAAVLRTLGRRCTIIMLEDDPMRESFGSATGRFLRGALETHGITVVGGDAVERYDGASGHVRAVRTKAGRRLKADVVVAGVGVQPDAMLGWEAGLRIGESGGLHCDAFLRSSYPRETLYRVPRCAYRRLRPRLSRGDVSTRTEPVLATGTWIVDPAHSSVEFSVKHMGIASVRGRFTDFEGTLELNLELAESRAHGAVKVASIDTGAAERDEHLRSPDFFDADQYPEISFESTRVEAIDNESSRVHGNLTMHGVTKEIRLDVLIQGMDMDPWANLRAGLEVIGTLKRRDFDMKFNQRLGSGNVIVGDKVKIAMEISAVLQHGLTTSA